MHFLIYLRGREGEIFCLPVCSPNISSAWPQANSGAGNSIYSIKVLESSPLSSGVGINRKSEAGVKPSISKWDSGILTIVTMSRLNACSKPILSLPKYQNMAELEAVTFMPPALMNNTKLHGSQRREDIKG